MPVETRVQAADEQVKQMMAMLAQMDEKMGARMKKMGEKMDSKGKQWMKK